MSRRWALIVTQRASWKVFSYTCTKPLKPCDVHSYCDMSMSFYIWMHGLFLRRCWQTAWHLFWMRTLRISKQTSQFHNADAYDAFRILDLYAFMILDALCLACLPDRPPLVSICFNKTCQAAGLPMPSCSPGWWKTWWKGTGPGQECRPSCAVPTSVIQISPKLTN